MRETSTLPAICWSVRGLVRMASSRTAGKENEITCREELEFVGQVSGVDSHASLIALFKSSHGVPPEKPLAVMMPRWRFSQWLRMPSSPASASFRRRSGGDLCATSHGRVGLAER